MKKALVVGAGFAGAVAARTLAEAGGWNVLVIDKRDHIGGNAHDYVNIHGIRVHKYGPHLWHTSNDEVHEWASRFTEWVPYRHHVRAQLADGDTVPLPINPETIETIFADRFDVWADSNDQIEYDETGAMLGYKRGSHAAFLETIVEHHDPVTNSRQHVENSVGKELCDLFFAPYTKKMWGLGLEDLPASVAARIPTNVQKNGSFSYDYFPNDKHQYVPEKGYTAMFENILDHENIKVLINADRSSFDERNYDHVFTSEPIDVYFDCKLGELPWRSIKMEVLTLPIVNALPSPVLNFTHDGPHTRVTEWKLIPAHGDNPYYTTLTFERPCDYRENDMERYYPVKTSAVECPNIALYRRYRDLAEQLPNVTFIGRCGMYVYQDMHGVISTTLSIVRKFLEKQNAKV